MKKQLILFITLFVSFSLFAQLEHPLRDANGRHTVGRGFVLVTTGDSRDLTFTTDDYKRMQRMGANYQVIRLEMDKISHFAGATIDEDYLKKLDALVLMGKNVGIKTVFKMTNYGIDEFIWEEFWLNKKGEHELYIEAWQVIWKRYVDETAVSGYDLLNEPRKLTMDISYDDLTSDYLVPFYQKLIDEKNKIDPEKYSLIQTIFMNKGEAINGNQYAEIKKDIDRENLLFAPHIYQNDRALVEPTMLRFDKESKLLDAPIFIGEWGFPTFDTTDSTMTGRLGQLNYMDFYMRTAELFDSLGIGSIKAWFSGNKTKQHFMAGGPSTWAIFADPQLVGTVERKYITDIISRPYPQSIAGDINSFGYDFATRSLDVYVTTDNSKGASRIFVGADRHYPDGFSIVCDDDFVLCYNPLKNVGLEVFKSNGKSNPADFIWNNNTQQLIILQWPEDKKDMHLRIIPGINN